MYHQEGIPQGLKNSLGQKDPGSEENRVPDIVYCVLKTGRTVLFVACSHC
jgi:hypothetical protein